MEMLSLVSVLVLLATSCQVDAIQKCDKNIVNNIHNIVHNKDGCPTGIYPKNHQRSPLNWVLLPQSSLTGSLKCIEGAIVKLGNDQSEAHIITQFVDKPNVELDYIVSEKSCGHIVEWDKKSPDIVYDVHVLDIDKVYCFYRCTDSEKVPKTSHYGACLVPKKNQNDLDVKNACEKCKKNLVAVGVNVKFQTLKPCP